MIYSSYSQGELDFKSTSSNGLRESLDAAADALNFVWNLNSHHMGVSRAWSLFAYNNLSWWAFVSTTTAMITVPLMRHIICLSRLNALSPSIFSVRNSCRVCSLLVQTHARYNGRFDEACNFSLVPVTIVPCRVNPKPGMKSAAPFISISIAVRRMDGTTPIQLVIGLLVKSHAEVNEQEQIR